MANNKKDNLGKFRLDSILIDHQRICIELHNFFVVENELSTNIPIFLCAVRKA